MKDDAITDWDIERSGTGEECLPRSAHPFLRQLYLYWRDLRRRKGGDLPSRQQIDPTAIGKILPWVWLTDVVGQPLRFRYRLIGTARVEAIGRNVTGCWLDEVWPGFLASEAHEDLVAVVERGIPSYRRGPTVMALANRGSEKRERLALPLSDGGRHVARLLGITIYQDRRIPSWAMCEPRRETV